jgi:hypothetical protein
MAAKNNWVFWLLEESEGVIEDSLLKPRDAELNGCRLTF